MHESSRTTRVLQPPRLRFILSTLALAFFWDLIPKGGGGFWPEMTMAVLTFWALRDPQRVGVGAAFTLGVMLDVGRGAALGQEALAFVWVVHLAQRRAARILWFGAWGQALLLLPLWSLALALQAAVRLVAGGDWPGWGYFGSAVTLVLLWPILSHGLLWPQWRAARAGGSASLS
jgi:rod shape-determining protein MreD